MCRDIYLAVKSNIVVFISFLHVFLTHEMLPSNSKHIEQDFDSFKKSHSALCNMTVTLLNTIVLQFINS